MTTKPDTLLWLDDHRGQYIPRDFANCWVDRDSCVSGIRPEAWAILEAGPDHEWYWDEWQYVCDNATVTMEGVRYSLHQDGALWLVPEGMEYNDQTDCFEWPDENPDEDDRDYDAPGWEGGFADNH